MSFLNSRRNVLGLAAIATLAGLVGSAQADVPLVGGNLSIANRFLNGDAHVVILGDSEQNFIASMYASTWNVKQWSGVVIGPNFANNTGDTGGWNWTSYNDPFINTNQQVIADQTGSGIVPFVSPSVTQQLTFSGARTSGPGNLLTNRVFSTVFTDNSSSSFNKPWVNSTGTLHVDTLVYANPQGVSTGAQMNVRLNSTDTPIATAPINAYSATPHWTKVSTTFQGQPWLNGNQLATDVQLSPNTTPAAGSNFITSGVRLYTDTPGFQLTSLAYGGRDVDYFIQGAKQNLDQFVNLTDTNTAYIWVGQNDVGKYTGAEFKSKMQDLIADYKAVRPDMQFVLVSTYDTGSTRLADYSQSLYDIAQSDSSVLFLNLYKAAGNFDYLNANYLADGTHPSLTGASYFAGLTSNLLNLAAAQAPEPTTAMLLFAAAPLLGRRRR